MKMRPILAVMAGPNGSGKTTLTKKLLNHQWARDCIYVNPDDIARDLFGDWNSPEAVLAAAQKAAEMRENCLARRDSLLFETVMSAPDKLEFLVRARDAGYFIRLFFVSTDSPTINASRIAQRVMEGGHTVPIEKIISRYTRSIANCTAVASIVDRLYVYDNSVYGNDATLLFRAQNGVIVKKYASRHSKHTWADSIRQAVEPGRMRGQDEESQSSEENEENSNLSNPLQMK